MKYMKVLILKIFTNISIKLQKKIIHLYSYRNQKHIKKIELINGEVKQLYGFGEMSIDNLKSVKESNMWHYYLKYFSSEIPLLLMYFIIALSIYKNAIQDIVMLLQSIIFCLNLIFWTWKCIIMSRNYRVIENYLNKKDAYILNNYIQPQQNLNQDSLEDYNSFFIPQKRISVGKIKIGDIIILQRHDYCPADILLLDSSSVSVQVDQSAYGSSNQIMKQPCQSTFVQLKSDTKGLLIEFKLNLNGQIAYDYEEGKMNSLQGTLKLKNDPKLFKFSEDNIIYCGEKLLNVDWVLGIVLVNGNNCLRIFKPIKIKSNTQFSVIIIIFILIALIISLLEYLVYSKSFYLYQSFNAIIIPQFILLYQELLQLNILIRQPKIFDLITKNNFEVNPIQNRGSVINQDEKYVLIDFHKVKNFNQAFPLNKLETIPFQLMIKPINYWQAISINLVCLEVSSAYFHSRQKVNSFYVEEKQYVIKYKMLQQFMQQNHDILSNNYFKGLLDTGRDMDIFEEEKREIQDVLIEERITSRQNEQMTISNEQFKSQKKIESQILKKYKKAVSFKTKIVRSAIDQSASINQIYKKQFNEEKLISNIFDDNDNLYHERIVAMLLLSNIQNKYNDKRKNIDQYTMNQEDYVVIEFCNFLDYKLKCSYETEKLIYDNPMRIMQRIIEIQGKLKKYQILSENHSTQSRNKIFSILLKDPEEFNDDEGTILYIKIEAAEVFDNQNFNIDVNDVNSTLYYMLRMGESPIIYLKKQLSKKEAIVFLENKESIINQFTQTDEQLDKLYLQMEQGAEILMIVGLHRKLNEQILSTIDKFNQARIKTWLITADDHFSIIRTLFDMKLIDNENNLLIFNEFEERKMQFQIEIACANLIKQQMILEKQEYEKKYILINCKGLVILSKNPNLLKHFAVILAFSRGLALFDSREISKSKIQKVTYSNQNQLSKLLNLDTCFIGDSLNNRRVYDNSSISIEINPKIISLNNPNFVVSDLLLAESIILNKSYISFVLVQNILYFWIYEMIFFVFVHLINQQFTNFSVVILFILSRSLTLIIQLFDHHCRINEQAMLKQRNLLEHLFSKMALFRISVVALGDIMIISIPLLATRYLYGDSNYLPISQIGFVTTIEIILQLQLVYQLQMNKIKAFMILPFRVIIIVLISFFTNVEFSDYKIFYQDYFYSPGSIIKSLIFGYLFAIILKLALITIFQLYDFEEFSSKLVQNHNDFKQVLHIQNLIQQKYSNKPLKEKILQQIFTQRRQYIKSILDDNDTMNDSIYKALNNNSLSTQSIEMGVNLKFKDQEIEQKYFESILTKNRLQNQLLLPCLLFDLVVLCNFLIQIKSIQYLENNLVLYILWGILTIFSSSLIFLNHFEVFTRPIILNMQYATQYSRLILYTLTLYLIDSSYKINNQIFTFILIQAVLSHFIKTCNSILFITIHSVLIALLVVIRFSIPTYYFTDVIKQLFLSIHITVILIVTNISFYCLSYVNEYLRRQFFVLSEKLDLEQKKLNEILGLLMPKFINERMARGHIHIQEDQGNVAILFCDICNFEDIVDSEKTQILTLLDQIYRQFDLICNQFSVQKIETVGKTYLCAAGLKDYDVIERTTKSATQRIFECAQTMMHAAQNFKYSNESNQIVIKIGIHFGQVMAGVIGSHKPQFSLIGDTMNTTSRVCSTGQEGKITLSELAYQKIKHLTKYSFIPKYVEAKGKGSMCTYQLIMNYQKSSGFTQRADKAPVIRLVNSIAIKSDNNNSPKLNQDPLGNGVIGFSMNIRPSSRKATVIIDKQISKVIQNVFTNIQSPNNPKVQQEISNRRQTMQRKSRVTRFKELNPFLRNSQLMIQQSNHQFLNQSVKKDNLFGDLIKKTSQNQNIQNIQQIDNLLDDFKLADSQQNLEVADKKKSKSHTSLIKSPVAAKQDEQGNHLFDSAIHQEDQIQIPKIQFIIGNQEKIESDLMHELVRMKCQDASTINRQLSYCINIFYVKAFNESFSVKQMVSIYNNWIYKSKLIFCIIFFIMVCLLQIILFNLIFEAKQDLGMNLTLIGLKITFIFLCCVIIPFCFKDTEPTVEYGLLSAYVFQLVFQVLQIQLNSDKLDKIYFTTGIISGIITNYYLRNIPFIQEGSKRFLFILLIIYIILNLSISEDWNETLIFIISTEIIIQIVNAENNKQTEQNYSIHRQLQKQQEQQQKIVNHLLPPHILQNFLKEQDSQTEVFENATILFADIAGFTKYSAGVDAQQVLQMLSSLFNKFDQSCAEHNLYKLYTIGDCYVVMGILDVQNGIREEEAFNVVNFGFKLIEIVNQLKQNSQFRDINMRIGIHTGTIIGGIVGTDVVRYDIYGEDVAIANKMESHGTVGKVMVSESTMQFLDTTYPDYFIYTLGNQVITPKRTIQGYFVDKIQIEE